MSMLGINRNLTPDTGIFAPDTSPGVEGRDEPKPLRGRAAERVLVAELLDALRHQAQATTAFMARLAGQVINDVLEVRAITFDATGTYAMQWKVAAGSISVSNPTGNGLVTVVSGGSTSTTAPTNGLGVYQVPDGQVRTVAIASRQATLFGTAGKTVSVQVFTSAVAPDAGS